MTNCASVMLLCSSVLVYNGPMPKHPFHVIEGKPANVATLKHARKAKPDAAHPLRCHRCAGSEVIETRIGMTYKAGKASGGTKQILCVTCLLNGQRVVIV